MSLVRVYARFPLASPAPVPIETRPPQKVAQLEEYMKTLDNNMAPLLTALETMMDCNKVRDVYICVYILGMVFDCPYRPSLLPPCRGDTVARESKHAS